jgi:hypothetical protein
VPWSFREQRDAAKKNAEPHKQRPGTREIKQKIAAIARPNQVPFAGGPIKQSINL